MIAYTVMIVTNAMFVWIIVRYQRETASLRDRLKDADKRYHQLYAEYVRALEQNPNRPRITTVTQEQSNAIALGGARHSMMS